MKNLIRSARVVALFIIGACFSQSAFSCSLVPPLTPRELFDQSVAVFTGTAISAELVNPDRLGSGWPDIPFIEVRWRVDEVFKGGDLDGGSALTQYVCGGVFITVGMPYVFAVGPVDKNEADWRSLPDVIGYLDADVTLPL